MQIEFTVPGLDNKVFTETWEPTDKHCMQCGARGVYRNDTAIQDDQGGPFPVWFCAMCGYLLNLTYSSGSFYNEYRRVREARIAALRAAGEQ